MTNGNVGVVGKPLFDQPGLQNRTLYHGDNLDFMRAMNSNSVHLIATDPPFNKGRDISTSPILLFRKSNRVTRSAMMLTKRSPSKKRSGF